MDRYRNNLKRASWDWLEDRRSGPKDRVNSRAEKRSARQTDQHEIEQQLPRPDWKGRLFFDEQD